MCVIRYGPPGSETWEAEVVYHQMQQEKVGRSDANKSPYVHLIAFDSFLRFFPLVQCRAYVQMLENIFSFQCAYVQMHGTHVSVHVVWWLFSGH